MAVKLPACNNVVQLLSECSKNDLHVECCAHIILRLLCCNCYYVVCWQKVYVSAQWKSPGARQLDWWLSDIDSADWRIQLWIVCSAGKLLWNFLAEYCLNCYVLQCMEAIWSFSSNIIWDRCPTDKSTSFVNWHFTLNSIHNKYTWHNRLMSETHTWKFQVTTSSWNS